jgi:hypothetical protein
MRRSASCRLISALGLFSIVFNDSPTDTRAPPVLALAPNAEVTVAEEVGAARPADVNIHTCRVLWRHGLVHTGGLTTKIALLLTS